MSKLERQFEYLSDKIGYDHSVPSIYKASMDVLVSQSMVSKKHKNDNVFLCQILHSRDKYTEKECLKKLSEEQIQD